MADVDDSGMLDFHELQLALKNNSHPDSLFRGETCQLMINLFDKDRDCDNIS